MEKKYISVESYEEAKANLKGNFFLKTNENNSQFDCFHVQSIEVAQFGDEKKNERITVLVVRGKHLTVDGSVVLCLNDNHIINEDFSFGNWELSDKNNDAPSIVAEFATNNGIIDICSNECDLIEFSSKK